MTTRTQKIRGLLYLEKLQTELNKNLQVRSFFKKWQPFIKKALSDTEQVFEKYGKDQCKYATEMLGMRIPVNMAAVSIENLLEHILVLTKSKKGNHIQFYQLIISTINILIV